MKRLIDDPHIYQIMGVKLGDLVNKREIVEKELSGKKVAVDTYNILYQFLASIRTPEGYPLSTSDGKIISHLKGLFNRCTHFISIGMKPVFVLDGEPHTLKKGTLDLRRERKERAKLEWEKALEEGDLKRARSKAQQTSRLTDDMVQEAVHLLDLLGVPSIRAPSDGEAQAAYMSRRGDVFGVVSQDMDTLLFGTKQLIRNLGISGRRKLPGVNRWVNVKPEIIDLKWTLNTLDITREQLVDMAILIGTDFNEGIKGIGPKRALSIIKKYGNLEIAAKDERIPLLEWDEIREIFLNPKLIESYDVEMGEIDYSGVEEYLVDEFGFGREGVLKVLEKLRVGSSKNSQSSLDSFFV